MTDPLFTQPDVTRLLDSLLMLQNQTEAKAYLRDLLTKEEILEFSRRLRAASLLKQGASYTTITKETGLSSTTIARISKWLNGDLGGYNLVLDRLTHMKPPRR